MVGAVGAVGAVAVVAVAVVAVGVTLRNLLLWHLCSQRTY